MKLFLFLIVCPLIFMSTFLSAVEEIDLAGEYQLHLESKGEILIPEGEIVTLPAYLDFKDTILLPGTTDLAKKGPRVTDAIPFRYHLNREYAHLGPAYYKRKIKIPASWSNKECELFLERVMWQSRVWLNGKEVGVPQDSLNTPHRHALGRLTPGEHELVIRVDNRMIHPVGDKGHAYGAQTQSIWNGIVGKVELRSVSPIKLVRAFPQLDGKVKVEVRGNLTGKLSAKIEGAKSQSLMLNNADKATLTLKVDEPVAWSEFTPKTYQLEVQLASADGKMLYGKQRTSFGFRTVSHQGNKLLINGERAFMRGNLECAVFPLTGHPPVTVEEWKRIWNIYRQHNLNHARFHSWCPPRAAFIAADEVGIYLQVEAPIWIDHWMTKPNRRKEMDTKGYPQGLGKNDRSTDGFALAEIRRTLDTYGNHPSFVFFAIGNELGTSNFEVTGKWMRDAKVHDPRRLYAASTARTITPHCDFNATHNIPGIGWVRQRIQFGTNWDYEKNYARAKVPIIAHEIGQWPVYVDWKSELPKYTGSLKPYRLQDMADEAKRNGLYDRSEELKLASGAMNRLLYRDEIESFLRTPSCRGFQLLSMQDFSGQGEALIGWLDSFYDSKGTTDAADFRRYCAPTVPLLKLPGYVFKTTDRPEIGALLHHYGKEDSITAMGDWKLMASDGRLVDSGKLAKKTVPRGTVTDLGEFTLDFSQVTRPSQLSLSIEIPSVGLTNSYNLWVYPGGKVIQEKEGVIVTSDWEGEAKQALERGKRVLLIAHELGGKQASKQAHWLPLYWSVPFFPGQSRDTIGLRVTNDHSAFANFPTPAFGDWNWHRLCRGARGFDVTKVTPNSYRPIAEPVTDFHINCRLASIFEAKVGEGGLLVCGYDVSVEKSKQYPEVAQLRASLLGYVVGEEFSPDVPVNVGELDKLFADPTMKLKKLPPQFADADLYVNAAGKLRTIGRDVEWKKGHDQIMRQAKGVNYNIVCDGVWRDGQGSAWHGKEMTLTVFPRAGVPGKLLVRLHDWNKNGRTGTLTFEGKTRDLGAHVQGGWVEFPVIREDTNDGELVLKTKALTGPNLMITDIVFVPEE